MRIKYRENEEENNKKEQKIEIEISHQVAAQGGGKR